MGKRTKASQLPQHPPHVIVPEHIAERIHRFAAGDFAPELYRRKPHHPPVRDLLHGALGKLYDDVIEPACTVAECRNSDHPYRQSIWRHTKIKRDLGDHLQVTYFPDGIVAESELGALQCVVWYEDGVDSDLIVANWPKFSAKFKNPTQVNPALVRIVKTFEFLYCVI